MTSFETSQGFANVEKYRINVTARLDTENREHMKALVEKTVKLWLYVAKNIEAGTPSLSYNTTPEDAVIANHFVPLSEPRVTVWGDLPGGSGFTVHSHSKAQDAFDVYMARHEAMALFTLPEPPQTVQNSAQATPTPQMPQNANLTASGNAQGHPQPLVTGVINATRAPNPKNVEYAADQLIAWTVNKVAMGANKGSATYALWGPLGQKYPLMTIYKNKPNSDENSPNYIAIKDFIVGLGLSVDAGKVEAAGNWTLVCKAAHVPQQDGTVKEYLNVVSMTPVQQSAAA